MRVCLYVHARLSLSLCLSVCLPASVYAFGSDDKTVVAAGRKKKLSQGERKMTADISDSCLPSGALQGLAWAMLGAEDGEHGARTCKNFISD